MTSYLDHVGRGVAPHVLEVVPRDQRGTPPRIPRHAGELPTYALPQVVSVAAQATHQAEPLQMTPLKT